MAIGTCWLQVLQLQPNLSLDTASITLELDQRAANSFPAMFSTASRISAKVGALRSAILDPFSLTWVQVKACSVLCPDIWLCQLSLFIQPDPDFTTCLQLTQTGIYLILNISFELLL